MTVSRHTQTIAEVAYVINTVTVFNTTAQTIQYTGVTVSLTPIFALDTTVQQIQHTGVVCTFLTPQAKRLTAHNFMGF